MGSQAQASDMAAEDDALGSEQAAIGGQSELPVEPGSGGDGSRKGGDSTAERGANTPAAESCCASARQQHLYSPSAVLAISMHWALHTSELLLCSLFRDLHANQKAAAAVGIPDLTRFCAGQMASPGRGRGTAVMRAAARMRWRLQQRTGISFIGISDMPRRSERAIFMTGTSVRPSCATPAGSRCIALRVASTPGGCCACCAAAIPAALRRGGISWR